MVLREGMDAWKKRGDDEQPPCRGEANHLLAIEDHGRPGLYDIKAN